MTSNEAIRKAIFHYSSEVKQGKTYAKPILEGLLIAEKQVKCYEKIQNFIKI